MLQKPVHLKRYTNEVNFVLKIKSKNTHDYRRRTFFVVICTLFYTLLCSALLGGCKDSPNLSQSQNSTYSDILAPDQKNENTSLASAENSDGKENPGDIADDASASSRQFKYYIQKLDEYGKNVRQTDYYEDKSEHKIENDVLDEKTKDLNTLLICIRHQYSYPVLESDSVKDTGWTVDDFKAMKVAKINSMSLVTVGKTNEYISLYFEDTPPEQIVEYAKELEKYECVKLVIHQSKETEG